MEDDSSKRGVVIKGPWGDVVVENNKSCLLYTSDAADE